jgi:hypothetical protein
MRTTQHYITNNFSSTNKSAVLKNVWPYKSERGLFYIQENTLGKNFSRDHQISLILV